MIGGPGRKLASMNGCPGTATGLPGLMYPLVPQSLTPLSGKTAEQPAHGECCHWSADYINSVISKQLMSCQIWEPSLIGHGARSCAITQKQPLGCVG